MAVRERLLVCCLLWATQASAQTDLSARTALSEEQQSSLSKPAEGQPTVVLDRLTFPRDVLGAAAFEKHLRKALRTEAVRADWGAGRDNRIEYRFDVTELRFTVENDALIVHCSAVGQLPGGHSAKSRLSFGGGLGERNALTRKVLSIVARGVITRLSELERRRRGLH